MVEYSEAVTAVTRTKFLAQNFFIYLFTVKVIRDLQISMTSTMESQMQKPGIELGFDH